MNCPINNSETTTSCHPVKLRLIWNAEETLKSGAQSKQCYNDTLVESSILAWRARIEKKLQRGPLSFRFFPSTPASSESEESQVLSLETEDDFLRLKGLYQSMVTSHRGPSTYRVVVLVAQGALQATCSGVQTRRMRASSSGHHRSLFASTAKVQPRPQADDAALSNLPGDFQNRRVTSLKSMSRTPNCPGAGTPVKRLRRHTETTSQDNTSAVVQSVPSSQSDVCWEQILRSIVKTVDRHHFGSKLAAIASSAS